MNITHIKKEYDRLASGYDSRWNKYLAATHEMVMELSDIRPDDSVVDVSGGTGSLSEEISSIVGEEGGMTLTDISEGMIREATEKLQGRSNIRILKSDVHDLALRSSAFDKVISSNAFHFYHDPHKAVSELYRVTKPGGGITIVDWCSNPVDFRIFNMIKKVTDKSHVHIYRTDELSELLSENGYVMNAVILARHGFWSLMGVNAKKPDYAKV